MDTSKLLHCTECVITGATSPVGGRLLYKLAASGCKIHAIGRGKELPEYYPTYVWHQCDLTRPEAFPSFSANCLFHVASIWLLPDRIGQFYKNGVRRIIAFSSTSRFSKLDSSSPAERNVADLLARSEDSVARRCQELGIAYTILRPTLIYGAGRDRNVADIARFAMRFGVFPILGKGIGLRQPVHVDDLAEACLQAAGCTASFDRSYNLSGGETLSYRQMVERVFQAIGKPPMIVSVPRRVFEMTIRLVGLFPKYKHLKPEMAMRMDRDLCFDHQAATEDFGYSPCEFYPNREALGLK